MNALGALRSNGIQGWNLAPSPRPALKASTSSIAFQDRVDFSSSRSVEREQRQNRAESRRESAPARENTKYYDSSADAKARDKFYGDTSRFDSMAPSQLFDELSDLIHSRHRPLDYKPDRYLYPEVDRHSDGELYCIYSGDGPKNPGDPGGQNPLSKGGYNCEHVVPQSWFNKKPAPRGDLHHLYASVIQCNSLRGNSQYDDGVIAGETMTSCGIYDKSKNLFNPNAGHGETARSVLYFMMAYPGEIGDRSEEYGVKDIPMLLKWHQENPPTEYERHRNQWIEKLQGNRNPLIDFPELASKIDFSRGIGNQGRHE